MRLSGAICRSCSNTGRDMFGNVCACQKRKSQDYFALQDGRTDIGHGHCLRAITWTADEHPSGWEVFHPDKRDPSKECGSSVWVARRVASNLWTLENWEPLTISPSVLCMTCGDHGFIRNGQWQPA